MDNSIKKTVKKTTYAQFQKLANLMEEHTHLATGSPVFGSSRAEMMTTWDTVAGKLNAVGPPERTGLEWKRIWADQKCRTKRKISENNKSLRETGGGPCRVNNLTVLEQDIDRICNLSSAAAPVGNIFGYSKVPKTLETKNILQITPPRGNNKVAVVTPTTSTQKRTQSNSNLQPSTNCVKTTPQRELPPSTITIQNTTPIQSPNILLASESQAFITSTPKTKQQSARSSQQRKRKCNETNENEEQIKLLRKQVKQQDELIEVMRTQAKSSKQLVEAVVDIADSNKIIAEAFVDIVNYFKDK